MSGSASNHVGSKLHQFVRRNIKGGVQSRAGRTALTAVVLVLVPWVAIGCTREAFAQDELASTCVSSLVAEWQTASISFEGHSYAVEVFSPVQVPGGQQRVVIS